MTNWTRSTNVSFNYSVGSALIHSIAAGNTYLRVHLRWGLIGDTSLDVDYQAISENIMSFGLVTTIGNGTETPPNARTGAGDASPPSQRWIYWETRAVRPTVIEASAGVVAWADAGSSEQTETKGQVLAPGMPAGDTLNLWASWAAVGAWDPSGSALVWFGSSTLTKL